MDDQCNVNREQADDFHPLMSEPLGEWPIYDFSPSWKAPASTESLLHTQMVTFASVNGGRPLFMPGAHPQHVPRQYKYQQVHRPSFLPPTADTLPRQYWFRYGVEPHKVSMNVVENAQQPRILDYNFCQSSLRSRQNITADSTDRPQASSATASPPNQVFYTGARSSTGQCDQRSISGHTLQSACVDPSADRFGVEDPDQHAIDTSMDTHGLYNMPMRTQSLSASEFTSILDSDPALSSLDSPGSALTNMPSPDSDPSFCSLSYKTDSKANVASSSVSSVSSSVSSRTDLSSKSSKADGMLEDHDGNHEYEHNARKNDGRHPDNPSNAQWKVRYDDLLAYIAEHGNCLVPYNYSRNMKLAQWVKRQRYQATLKYSGRSSTLTDEREKLLNDVDFVWDSQQAVWEEKFEELLAYKEKYGDCNVPTRYQPNRSLAAWVKFQRRQRRLVKDGVNVSLSRERQEKLESIGFVWGTKRRVSKSEK